MTTSSNKLVSHTSIYMLGDILRRSVSLIMLPIYTRYLTPEDYGVVELLSMLIDFASIIFGAQVSQAIFRYYCTTASDDEKRSIISSALFLSGSMNIVGAAFVSLLAAPLSIVLFSNSSFESFIILFAVTMLLEPFMAIPLIHIRAKQKPWLFLIFSSMKLVLQLSLNIYFVVIQDLHVEGVIYSAIISSVVMSIILTTYSVRIAGISVKLKACKTLFSFSLPLKLATIGSFYLAFGDRYVLNIFTDLSQVGIYALGYKFGFIFLILTWDPFQKMWDTEKYQIHKKGNAKKIYQTVFVCISFVLILAGLSISLLTKDLLKIMSDPAFLSAHEIVPIIIIAYIFQAWTKYCSFGILIEGKTMHIAYAEILGVLAITVAYFTLIPSYGIHGAAWATVIGFVVRFYWTNLKGKQFYNMHLPWRKISAMSLLATAVFFLSLFSSEEILQSIIFRTGLIALFCILFFILPILSKSEKKLIWGKVRFIYKKSIFSR